MTQQLVRKSGFRAAFFWAPLAVGILASSHECHAQTVSIDVVEAALSAQDHPAAALASDPVWHALLHMERGRPRMMDPSFLLTASAFSPERELAATLLWMQQDPVGAACRFPARTTWLSERLALRPAPVDACDDLQEFLRRAPAQRIGLAFASENIAQPASMMGHVFLTLEGVDPTGRTLQHAVSFYTNTDSWNYPKLLFDSLVTGKEGYFSLLPFSDARALYVHNEQRTLWELELGLDQAQRRRVQYHLHELKQTRFKYYFQGYNCATLIKHVIGVAHPAILDRHDPWTTPNDVVRHAEAEGLIRKATLEAPARWQVDVLKASLPNSAVRRAQGAAASGLLEPPPVATPEAQQFVEVELARAYVESMRTQGRLTPEQAATRLDMLDARKDELPHDLQWAPPPANDPRRARLDTQASLGIARVGSRLYLQADFLPVSHRLEDGGPRPASETSLALLEVSVLQPLQGGAPRLKRLTLYGIDLLLPRDPLLGGLSGRLRIGLDDEDPAAPDRRLHARLGGALGWTWRLHQDVDGYALAGADLYGRAGWQVRTSQEAGLVVREALGMKSIVSHSWNEHPQATNRRSRTLHWTQSVPLAPDLSAVMTMQRIRNGTAPRSEASLMVKWLY